MLTKYLDTLNQLRNKKIGIEEFVYVESQNAEGHSYDINERKRFHLLIALQYDRTSNDETILKDLLHQEIIMHRKSTFQGLYPSLNLNAFLLARFKDPENVWLLLEAKGANFDTHCGFDYEFIVSAGIPETFEVVNRSDHKLKEEFHKYISTSPDTCPISSTELEEWWKYKNQEYPATLSLKNIDDEIMPAIDLDENGILQEKVGQWKNSQAEWSLPTLNQLSYYDGLIGNLEGQIFAHEKIYELQTSDWDKASTLEKLSSLYLKTLRLDLAWDKIKTSQKHLARIPDWKKVGLGRFILERAFDVVLHSNDATNIIAQETFSWAIKKYKR